MSRLLITCIIILIENNTGWFDCRERKNIEKQRHKKSWERILFTAPEDNFSLFSAISFICLFF